MNEPTKKPLSDLETVIGYVFKNKQLAETALTHSSYSNEVKHIRHTECNERMEFFGDSILSFVTGELLYLRYTEKDEGFLTRTRAAIVCENALAGFALDIDLGDYMYFGHGENVDGEYIKKSVLSDAFEALIAAIYFDGGIEAVTRFLHPRIEAKLDELKKTGTEDYKTQLQKIAQETPEELLRYELVEESGPPHDRMFVSEVYLNSNLLGRGSGRSKRVSEQEAAKKALIILGVLNEETP